MKSKGGKPITKKVSSGLLSGSFRLSMSSSESKRRAHPSALLLPLSLDLFSPLSTTVTQQSSAPLSESPKLTISSVVHHQRQPARLGQDLRRRSVRKVPSRQSQGRRTSGKSRRSGDDRAARRGQDRGGGSYRLFWAISQVPVSGFRLCTSFLAVEVERKRQRGGEAR